MLESTAGNQEFCNNMGWFRRWNISSTHLVRHIDPSVIQVAVIA